MLTFFFSFSIDSRIRRVKEIKSCVVSVIFFFIANLKYEEIVTRQLCTLFNVYNLEKTFDRQCLDINKFRRNRRWKNWSIIRKITFLLIKFSPKILLSIKNNTWFDEISLNLHRSRTMNRGDIKNILFRHPPLWNFLLERGKSNTAWNNHVYNENSRDNSVARLRCVCIECLAFD